MAKNPRKMYNLNLNIMLNFGQFSEKNVLRNNFIPHFNEFIPKYEANKSLKMSKTARNIPGFLFDSRYMYIYFSF